MTESIPTVRLAGFCRALLAGFVLGVAGVMPPAPALAEQEDLRTPVIVPFTAARLPDAALREILPGFNRDEIALEMVAVYLAEILEDDLPSPSDQARASGAPALPAQGFAGTVELLVNGFSAGFFDTNAEGRAIVEWQPFETGSFTLQIAFNGSLTHQPAQSEPLQVTVVERSPPPHDDFANRFDLTPWAGIYAHNTGATRETGEPELLESAAHTTSVWHQWTAPATGRLTIDSDGWDAVGPIRAPTFNTMMGLYRAGAPSPGAHGASGNDNTGFGDLVLLDENDMAEPPFTWSRVSADVAEGETYFLVVAGFFGESGDYLLNVVFEPDGAVQTTTTLAASPATAQPGAPVELVARVAVGQVPVGQGSVTFRRNGSVVGQAPVSDGGAVLVVDDLPGGSNTITAHYGGAGNFGASQSAPTTVVVVGSDQTIAFTAPPDQTFAPGATLELSATATSGLPVAFSSRTSAICSVSGSTVTLLSPGLCTIRATQDGNANWNAAPPVDRSFEVIAPGAVVFFVGGGVVFGQTSACAPALGSHPHAVTVRYRPSELGGLPSELTLAWPEGSEHLALWGAMAPSGDFLGAAGRQSWSRFVFYPTRPRMRVVTRQVTQPPDAALAQAEELVLRIRAQNFAAIPDCAATIAATLRQSG